MDRKRAALAVVVLLGVAYLYGVTATPRVGTENPDREVVVETLRDRSISVTVTVEHGSAELSSVTRTVAPDSEVVAALLATNPFHIGRPSVTVTASTPGGRSAPLELGFSGCRGPAHFTYGPDGEVSASPYSVVC
ncbi:hypothetical protein I7X12_07720 [Halosimplex litoreum]|uniref:Uncharacterized protein n=1 Tax=Halosimplex litoreum TaxID=1198301 RepID=A0A7T3G179_9EURY|nr:hypothetical protein [Halosimplex litoreum]QPV64489.1 hypothetical protein I7X12_07720 [Halosimplex litoreum]